MNAAQSTLTADFDSAIAYLPHLFAGILIFGVGAAIAFALGKVAKILSARLGLDRAGARRGVSDDLQSLGVRTPLSALLGRIVFVIVLTAALVQALDAADLAPLADELRQLLGYMPRLVLAIVILLLGAAIGDAIGEGVSVSARRAGVLYDGLLGALARGLIVVLAILMALQQLTIDATFILDVLVLGLGGIVVAFAIASGWGTRTIVENIVAGRYVHQTLAVGDVVEADGLRGTVESIDIASTTLSLADGARVVVPNGYFLTRTVRKTAPPPAVEPPPP